MAGTDFVTQEEAVVAHLFWAMAAVEQVTVAVAGRAISGRLLAPDPDARAVIFEPTPGQTIPERVLRKGKMVLVKYASLEDEYQFKSQLIDVQPATWQMSIPRDVRRNDRRMIVRRLVHASRRYTVQLIKPDGSQRTLLVHDISPAGLSITFDPQLDRFEEGQVFRGVLSMPGQEEMTIRFEVVSIHSIEGDGSHRMIGCRFVGLGFSGCERIALAVDGDPS